MWLTANPAATHATFLIILTSDKHPVCTRKAEQAWRDRAPAVTESVGAGACAAAFLLDACTALAEGGGPSSGAGAASALFTHVIWKLWMYRASKAASQYAK